MSRALLLSFGFLACAAPSPPPAGSAAEPAPPVSSPNASVDAPPTPTADAAAAADPCAGASLDLLATIANPACHISENEGDALREVLEDPKRTPLRVEAELRSDRSVLVRIVNTGSSAETLPFLVHSHLESFPVRAGKQALAAPEPGWPKGFAFPTGRLLAKVGLPPGGKTEAVIRLKETVVVHETPKCPPNAKCGSRPVEKGSLAKGKHTLSIRTPLYSIREDLTAELHWTVE